MTSLIVIFVLLGSGGVKAARKALMKSTPERLTHQSFDSLFGSQITYPDLRTKNFFFRDQQKRRRLVEKSFAFQPKQILFISVGREHTGSC
jgi:hypothetical protein